MKRPWTQHVGDFIAGKGFYIVLFLCVAAIGISGYYLFSSLGTGGEDTLVDAPAQVIVTPSGQPSPAPSVSQEPAVRPTVTAQPTPTPTPTPEATPTPTASAPAMDPVFVWPVQGEIIYDFSLETLAYDETMGDWRTHCGIDIAASVGTEVMAAASGVVERVYEDDLMGTTVVIDHGNGLKSFYSNLAVVPTVEVGDQVSTGDIIGSVGETALAESGRAAHLHLEMTDDDLIVDPVNYLPS